jgi:hypothetical protein
MKRAIQIVILCLGLLTIDAVGQQFDVAFGLGGVSATSASSAGANYTPQFRFYVFGNLFVRPEVHLYLIDNNYDFSGPWAVCYGASVGYTFRSSEY